MSALWLYAFLLIGLGLAARPTLAGPPATRLPHLTGDRVVFKFTTIKYFIFIEGEVNGVKGKFMFDTGCPSALALNNHYVALPGGQALGQGMVGSGQTYTEYRYDTVRSISFGGLSFRNAGPLEGNNQHFIEEDITPQYLGLIGYDFFRGYLFKIDYERQLLTFYKDTPARRASADFLRGEQLLTTLDFETRKRPNDPIIQVELAGRKLPAAFDTGQIGGLYLVDSLANKLVATGQVVRGKEETATIRALTLPGGTVAQQVAAGLLPPARDFARSGVGLTEPSTMYLGYGFLKLYTTIWDFPQHKIYLLRR